MGGGTKHCPPDLACDTVVEWRSGVAHNKNLPIVSPKIGGGMALFTEKSTHHF